MHRCVLLQVQVQAKGGTHTPVSTVLPAQRLVVLVEVAVHSFDQQSGPCQRLLQGDLSAVALAVEVHCHRRYTKQRGHSHAP